MNGVYHRPNQHWQVGQRLTAQQLKDFRAALDILPDAAYLIDTRTLQYIEANRAASENTGYTRDELLAHGPRELIADFQQDHLGQHLKELGGQVGQTLVIETSCLRKNGERYPAELFVRSLETDAGNFLLATVRDTTERRKSEEALRRRDGQLLHAQKLESISVLASGVAHEFNNLLQIIVGVTHASMASLDEQDEVREDLQYVLDAAQKATHLTRQLLGFSQRQVMKPIEIPVAALILDLAKTLRPIMGEHIELETKLDRQPMAIFADPTIIQEILINLCINARDAMPDGGRLVISAETVHLGEPRGEGHPPLLAGPYTKIQLTDTGCGMSPDVLQRIFDPFYTTKELGQGTGLGLSMVYGAIQQLEGSIEVESKIGKGSTFTIYLPAVKTTSAAPAPAVQLTGRSTPPVESGAETILVVDDEPIIRDFAVHALARAGYNTLTAADGEEALHIVQERGETISLVLLDVVMPKMGGHETYERIRQLHPGVKAVFCSAFDPEADQVDFIREAGLRLIQKPVNPPALLQTVREVLDEQITCPLA